MAPNRRENALHRVQGAGRMAPNKTENAPVGAVWPQGTATLPEIEPYWLGA